MSETEATLPITNVTLYTSGVGYFERGGEVEGDARLTLLFPVGQVNDVLKSLVLLDTGGGEIRPVTYAAQDPVSRALQAFSVDVGDNPDRATLLNRMRGTSVTVSLSQSEALTGTIVGVESHTVTLPDVGSTEQYLLNLLAEDGLHTVSLSDVRRLQFNDAKLSEELRQALAAVAQGRDANKRPLTLTFSGPGRRPVLVGYIAEAPAWQTTYRLVLGDTPLLQGWALVQNTGQDDWTDARLTLVSGRPISFIQDLYTPLYVHRPRVQPRIPASPTPQTYDSGLQFLEEREVAAAPAFAAAAAPAAVPAALRRRDAKSIATDMSALSPEQQSVATSGAQLGAALFAYHIDVPVSIPRQQSAMIPFTASEIEAERVSVYNAQVQKDHPLTGVRLKNTTDLHLMGGPLTVFDRPETGGEAGYVGDALMDDTEPGQTRLLTYAMDLAVDAERQQAPAPYEFFSAAIAQGRLQVTHRSQQAFQYTFKNHSATPRTVVVEHPHLGPQWQLLEPAAPTERTAQAYRFDLPVPPHDGAELTVRLETLTTQTTVLTSITLDSLVLYASSTEMTGPVKEALDDLLQRRRVIADFEAKIDDIDGQQEAIAKEQARIRQNMQNLEYKSDLYKRYVGELDAQENQIKGMQARREALRVDLTAAQAELYDRIAALDIS